jgi:hypothetical protein
MTIKYANQIKPSKQTQPIITFQKANPNQIHHSQGKPNPNQPTKTAPISKALTQPTNTENATNVSLPSLYNYQRTKTRPAHRTRNIKGTVSGTLHAACRIWRGAGSTPPQARMSTLCHIYFQLQKSPEILPNFPKPALSQRNIFTWPPPRKAAMSATHGPAQAMLSR